MGFDYERALNSGASEDQIIDYLTRSRNFDVQGALNAGASKTQIIEHLAKKDSAPTGKRKKEGFLGETARDLKETFNNIKSEQERLTNSIQRSADLQADGEQGIVRTGLQIAGKGLGSAARQVGNVVIGAGKAVLPQRAEDTVSRTVVGGVQKAADTKAGQAVVRGLGRYQEFKQNLPGPLQEDIGAIEGLTEFATEALGAGTSKRAATGAARTLNRGVDAATQSSKEALGTAKNVGRKVADTAGDVAANISGKITGTDDSVLKKAFEAGLKGGDEATAFKNALRNPEAKEEIAVSFRNAVQEAKRQNTARYGKALDEIGDSVVDASGVRTRFVEQLNDFGVKVTDEGLDFSNSPLRTVPAAQSKLSTAYAEISSLPPKPTIKEIDTMRRALDKLELAGEDGAANTANSLISRASNEVKTAGKQAEGYQKMLSDFAEEADFLDELQRGLMAKEGRTIDQTMRALTHSMNLNNERRLALIKRLEQETGENFVAQIAGTQLSELLPRGLVGRIGGAALVGAGIANLSVPGVLIPLVLSSPKVTGEFVYALGLTARKTQNLLDTISAMRRELSAAHGIPESELGNYFRDLMSGAIGVAGTEGIISEIREE